MSGLGVVLSILIAVLSLILMVNHGSRNGLGRRLAKYRNTFAVTNCALVVLLLMTNYRESRQWGKRGEDQRQTLEAKIDDLSRHNQTLIGRDQAFADQLSDCNARAEALTKKLHARVHFTRGISEPGGTKDSVSGKRNK